MTPDERRRLVDAEEYAVAMAVFYTRREQASSWAGFVASLDRSLEYFLGRKRL
jgi:hypothetical protein